MPKLSSYANVAAASVAAADLVAIVQTAATQNKTVRWDNVLQAALLLSAGDLTYDGTTLLLASGKAAKFQGDVTLQRTSATALVVGRQGTTNPALRVSTSNASGVTGVQMTALIAGSGFTIAVISSAADDTLFLDGKGAGGITLQATATGNVQSNAPLVVQSASANAVAFGRQGTTSPGLLLDASVAVCVTGLKIVPNAAGSGLALSLTGGNAAEALKFDAKGTGNLLLQTVATGNVQLGQNLQFPSAGNLVDPNNNELIKFPATVGSAVNEVTVTNAATGVAPSIKASGGDTDVTLELGVKGTLGVVQLTGPSADKRTLGTPTDTATLTIAQLLTKYLDSVPTAAANYTLPTAANLVAGIKNCKVGDSFDVTIDNRSGGANTITVLTNTGVTLRTKAGSATIAQNDIRTLTVVVTNVGGGSEAYRALLQ